MSLRKNSGREAHSAFQWSSMYVTRTALSDASMFAQTSWSRICAARLKLPVCSRFCSAAKTMFSDVSAATSESAPAGARAESGVVSAILPAVVAASAASGESCCVSSVVGDGDLDLHFSEHGMTTRRPKLLGVDSFGSQGANRRQVNKTEEAVSSESSQHANRNH